MTMNQVFRAFLVFSALLFSAPSFAGNWSATELSSSPPLWYEYRASVNDSGTIAGTELLGRSPEVRAVARVHSLSEGASTLDTQIGDERAYTQGYAQDISADDHVVGFRAQTRAVERRALRWVNQSGVWVADDLHASAAQALTNAQISAAYGLSERVGNERFVAGYVRHSVNPSRLSQPLLWTVGATTTHATLLPLPENTTYGIAYGVSEPGAAGARFVCGGAGRGAGFMQAACWDITNPSAPADVTPPAALRVGGSVATSVVNRVRTINVGSAAAPEWKTFAVGYFVQTGGEALGFVWDIAAGVADVNTAMAPDQDAILSDVTRQSFTQNTAQPKGSAIYHGPMVVGTGTSSARLGGQGNPFAPAPVRALAQTRIAARAEDASTTETCNLDAQTAGLHESLAHVSGASPNALHMVGYSANGMLVRLQNQVLANEVQLYVRQADVYTSATSARRVEYHWAEVLGSSSARVIWSDAAGCEVLRTGLACSTSLAGTIEDARTRRNTLLPTAAYVQGTLVDTNGCGVTPVYAVEELKVSVNPGSDTTGALENWDDCSGNRSGDTRWSARVGSGYNINVNEDFFHCGRCNVSADDRLACTADFCVNGSVVNTLLPNRCIIDGGCVNEGATSPQNICKACRSNVNPRVWSNKDNGVSCTRTCYTGAACSNGTCSGGTAVTDAWEANNSSGAAASIRSFNEDDHGWSDRGLIRPTIFPQSSDVDWYKFRMEDCYYRWGRTCGNTHNGATDGGQPRVRVRLTPPPNVNLNLCVYMKCVAGGNPEFEWKGVDENVVAGDAPSGYIGLCSNGTGDAVELIEFQSNCSGRVNDTSDILIKVTRQSGITTCENPYALEWGKMN